MPAYYNEIDPYVAQWLRNLIAAGHIAPGEVDERSILDVRPDDLRGFEQCHFFAGIGGWSYALRLAGFGDDRPVWTGSCPCQPFSLAGKQKGFDDERHLWPVWFNLIRECGPSIVFGEQVASATVWLDGVCADMESADYAIGAACLPAASVNAPHYRYRLFFVAYADGAGLERVHAESGGEHLQSTARDVSGDDWQANPDVLRAINGLSARLDRPPQYKERIRALGNAIVPQVAAQFIAAAM